MFCAVGYNLADCSAVGHDLSVLSTIAYILNRDLTYSQVLELPVKKASLD